MKTLERFVTRYDTVYLRGALAAGFLSAVADRFGLWGPPGSPSVAWGNFGNFIEYTGQLNFFVPERWVLVIAWIATGAEIVLGFTLALGLFTRRSALASGVLLSLFALGMTLGTGVKSALDASVFAASAAAFTLSVRGPYPFSLDQLRGFLDDRG